MAVYLRKTVRSQSFVPGEHISIRQQAMESSSPHVAGLKFAYVTLLEDMVAFQSGPGDRQTI